MVFAQIFIMFFDFVHFSRNSMRLPERLASFCTYWRLWLKGLTGMSFSNSERFHGMRASGFNYKNIASLYREIFFRGTYNFNCAKKDPLILDLGANIGMATLYFKHRFPKAEIHAFEPDSYLFSLMEKNTSHNRLKKVFLYKKAVCGKTGKISFYSDKGGGLTSTILPGKGELKQKTTVDSVSIASFVKSALGSRNIDFVKMDIEGAEHSVIDDLHRAGLLGRIGQMVIEYHHKLRETPSILGGFLIKLEEAGFEYQLNATSIPVSSQEKMQDVFIYAYRKR